MPGTKPFFEHIEKAVASFKKIDPNETIRVVSHLDADGICACSVLLKAFNLDNRKYSISIVQQLDAAVLRELAAEEYKCVFFTDIGSGQLRLINKYLKDRTVFVLDHHEPEQVTSKNIVHINPHLFGVGGSKEISGAGVVFLFASALNKKVEEYAHLAVIGAIGDVQDEHGFSELNQHIIKIAEKHNKLKVIKGLRMFGAQTRPLHKLLEYCTDIYIPGVSGSESGAIQLLRQLGIDPKKGKKWRKLVDLSDEELRKLVEGLIMRRIDEADPEEIIGPVYILKEEEKGSPLRDAREFSTLLNSCGRMGKASLGIGACLGDPKLKKMAIANLAAYRKEIVKAIKWYEENKDTKMVQKEKGLLLLHAQDHVMPTIIGTLASIISKSNDLEKGTFIISMAQLMDDNTKVSIRVVSQPNGEIDLQEIISAIVDKLGVGLAGGHKAAAGAIIPTDKEEDFIDIAKNYLHKLAIEEKV